MILAYDLQMFTHGDIYEKAVEGALRLIDESPNGETTGEDLARELGIAPDQSEGRMALYNALMAAKDRGAVRADFPGGMQLPERIRR